MKKGVLRNFAKFTGKHLCHSLSLRPATLLKKRLWHKCFPVKICEISKSKFSTEHFQTTASGSANIVAFIVYTQLLDSMQLIFSFGSPLK